MDAVQQLQGGALLLGLVHEVLGEFQQYLGLVQDGGEGEGDALHSVAEEWGGWHSLGSTWMVLPVSRL
jgi:hypothetical protein